MITGVAIKTNDGIVHSLPKPSRHHNLIHKLAEEKKYPTPISGEQGFIDDELGFLGRGQALQRAIDIGQIEKGKWGGKLYSEDLW